MNGEELAARYAYPPNSKGYCGKPSFRSALAANVSGDKNSDLLRSELKHFKVHYAYLGLISKANGLDRFDKSVVEAFWIGNHLLEGVPTGSIAQFIIKDLFYGKKNSRAEELVEHLPEGVVPHHSFNSLYINFVTESVERSLKNYDSCCITFGKVTGISGNRAMVLRQSIGWENGFILREVPDSALLEKRGVQLVKGLKRGDLVSMHWGMVVQKIDRRGFNLLRKYTQKNIDAINGAL